MTQMWGKRGIHTLKCTTLPLPHFDIFQCVLLCKFNATRARNVNVSFLNGVNFKITETCKFKNKIRFVSNPISNCCFRYLPIRIVSGRAERCPNNKTSKSALAPLILKQRITIWIKLLNRFLP